MTWVSKPCPVKSASTQALSLTLGVKMAVVIVTTTGRCTRAHRGIDTCRCRKGPSLSGQSGMESDSRSHCNVGSTWMFKGTLSAVDVQG